jgi:hypothetical protein
VSVNQLAFDDEELTIIAVTGNVGWFTWDGSRIAFAPPTSAAAATYRFTATVRDPGGLTVDAVINVSVANQPPNANSDSYPDRQSNQFDFNPTLNDSDPEGGGLSIQTVNPPTNGSVVTHVGNDFHAQLVAGVTTFSYTIVDDGGLTATATVTITWEPPPPPNSPPSVPDKSVIVGGGQQVVHLTVVVTDVDGDQVEMNCKGPAGFIVFPTEDSGGSDPTQSNWSVSIGLPDGWESPALVQCTATDPDGASGTGTFTLTSG